MATLYFDENDHLDTIITRIRESPDAELALFIPEDSVFYQNEINRKILEKITDESGKTVKLGNEGKTQEQDKNTVQHSSPITPITQSPTPHGEPSPTKSKTHRFPGPKIFAVLLAFFGLFALGACAFTILYLPKATITILVEEKILEKEGTIEISPDITTINFADKKIPGKVLSVTEQEKKNFSATGEKTVGEKAEGTVTLQNWTDEETLLQAGTKLIVVKGENGEGLTFVLDSGVSVSAQTFSIPTPGQKLFQAGTANVTAAAVDIGEKYNLSANTNFKVEGFEYSQFSATNETAFSGGLTREVIIVSQEDLDKAREELKAKLLAKAREDLGSKVLGDQKLLEEVIAGDVLGVDFSHEVGEETGSFEASVKTQSSTTVYSESKLKELAGKILEENVPDGFEISSKDLGVSIGLIEPQIGGALQLAVHFKTLVIPVFDKKKLIEELSGKRVINAETMIKNLPHIQSYSMSFWPKFPAFLQIFPLRIERLTVEIEAQK